MARLYHKAYRRGSGRKGGFKKASPDPVAFADLPTYAASSATEPSYLGTVADDVTGATIHKISDDTTFGTASTRWLGTDYSTHPVDLGPSEPPDYVMIGENDGHYAIYGPAHPSTPWEYQSTNSGFISDPFVSSVFENRIWGIDRATARLMYSTFNPGGSDSTTTVRDFRSTYDYINGFQFEGAPSWDEDVWPLILHRASDDHWVVVAYRVSNDTIQGVWDTGAVDSTESAGEPSAINWVHCSPLGSYILAGMDGTLDGKAAGVHVFDASDMSYLRSLTGATSGHHDMQVLEDGQTEVLVQTSGNDLCYWDVSTGTKTVVVTNILGQVTNDGDYHLSGRAIKRPGYIYVSFHSPGTAKLDNSVIAVRLATGEVEKWAFAQQPGTDSYDLQTRVVASMNGKRVYFSAPSPWRTDVNATRCYVATFD